MLGFIVAVIAGYLTPHADAPLGRPTAALLDRFLGVEPGEIRLVSFMLVLLLAGVVSSLLNSGSAFWIILGGALGYFATRIVTALREMLEKRRS